MGLAPGSPVGNTQCRIKRLHRGGGITMIPDDQLIIKLPDSRVLKVIARSVLLALAIITSPWLGSPVIGDSTFSYNSVASEAPIHGDSLLPVTAYGPQILNTQDVDLISESDAKRQISIPDGTFYFVFASGFLAGNLKTSGIVAIQLSNDASNAFHKPSNYKFVYLRKFEYTVLAMKKTGPAEMNAATKRCLCALSSKAKRAALNGLEDVLLEPPRASSVKQSNIYLKNTKYLPDLMDDSLEVYPRRIFIDVGFPDKDDNGSPIWFERNYPTRNKDFEMYKIETVNEEVKGDLVPQMCMSDWLKNNVKEEEFVVMKAEAEVVEEMKKKTKPG
ncbi:hypothetical protein NE237_014413 [Protea cynaroides]|uniref:DUF7870 domain-containing protein n=1 Tax=Protea cynaroides TaxID=273540 RepID=A0A9Q0KC19_9MAGN|nr:hypothetical protein NE237_014413 [Protea cynaroides]